MLICQLLVQALRASKIYRFHDFTHFRNTFYAIAHRLISLYCIADLYNIVYINLQNLVRKILLLFGLELILTISLTSILIIVL